MSAAFGPFDLVKALGRGGMGEVFLARRRDHPADGNLVLKRLRPELAETPEFKKRLLFEAQVASRIVHPNLVRFLEFGRVGQCDYLVMEHVAGFSLKRLLDHAFEHDQPPPMEVALSVVEGILEGLSAMHRAVDESGAERPILHRDVTPANVIVTHDGRPVLIDFGIAKDVLGPAITQMGKVIGTVRYMAPEHRRGEFIEPSADVFSVSMILFELLTARHPWPPMFGMRELLRTVFDPPEVDEVVRARIPEAVLPIVLRGLECDAKRRFPDAPAMLAALREAGALGAPPEAALRAWLASAAIEADEALAGLVVDTQLDAPAQPAESLYWDHKGRISEQQPMSRPMDTIPPSQALTIPPLPPRRHSVLDTGDLEVPAGVVRVPAMKKVLIGALVAVGLLIGWVVEHFLL